VFRRDGLPFVYGHFGFAQLGNDLLDGVSVAGHTVLLLARP
jgi:hypothetical protein